MPLLEKNAQQIYLDEVRDLVLAHFRNKNPRIFLFGSRARSKHAHSADIDVGFLGDAAIDRVIFREIADAIEQRAIPLKVDLVDFFDAEEPFRTLALKDTIAWN